MLNYLMDKIEIVKKAVEVLNKAKNINYVINSIYEDSYYGVVIDLTWPSGHKQFLSFSDKWFEPDWDCKYISWYYKDKIPQDADDETKVIMRLIAHLWEERYR